MGAWTRMVSSYQGGQEDNHRVADAISKDNPKAAQHSHGGLWLR